MDPRIIQIAEAVRDEVHEFEQEEQRPGYGPHAHENLSGYCAIASYLLISVTDKLGYNLDLVVGRTKMDLKSSLSNHAWAEHENEILDITATQFWTSVKRVHVTKCSNRYYRPIAKNEAAHNELKNRWSTQSPYTYMGDLDERAYKLAQQLAPDQAV
jgi:hypothetical protein